MGILRVDGHPGVHRREGHGRRADEFNISVGVTDAFMKAVRDDTEFDLAHVGRPSGKRMTNGVTQRMDGLWVYDRVRARQLFELITRSTYDHGEPGIFFLDRVREENNLAYAEEINACNPCAEQPLASCGCCCLASINLTRFVEHPFAPDAKFDFGRFAEVARVGVRMLDNVLDGTCGRSRRNVNRGFFGNRTE